MVCDRLKVSHSGSLAIGIRIEVPKWNGVPMSSLSPLAQIAQQLESVEVKARKLALAALRTVPPADAVPLIKRVLADPDQQMRSMAVYALGARPTAECLGLLLAVLVGDEDYGVRADAAGALGQLADQQAVEPLIRAFERDPDWLVRFSAVVSLGNLGDVRAVPTLLRALDCPELVIQQSAIAALGEVGAVGAIDRILRFVTAADWLVRQRLAEALGNLPSEKSRSALRYLSRDSHPNVAAAAQLALSADGTTDAMKII
jgi:HEAT repeat protein